MGADEPRAARHQYFPAHATRLGIPISRNQLVKKNRICGVPRNIDGARV